MFRKLLCLLLVGLVLVGCTNAQLQNDAQTIKNIYEELNDTIREKDGKTIRSIEIPEENPMVISSPEEVLEKMQNKDSFIVYFGFPSCPWCRSVLPIFIEVAKEYNIQKVYYVDVETIRDTLSMDEEGNIVQEEKGSESYYQLLEALKDVLEEYEVEGVDMHEKRIYAPNFVAIQQGKPIELIEGQSALQTDGYMELNEEMIQDMKTQFEEFFQKALNESAACDTKC